MNIKSMKTHRFRYIIWGLLFLLLIVFKADLIYAKYSPEKAGFKIKFKQEISPYNIVGIFVLPNEVLHIEILDDNKNNSYLVTNEQDISSQLVNREYKWQAPASKGLYKLKIQNNQTIDSMMLNVFVMIPFKQLKGEYLNKYRIGKYPDIPLKKLAIYNKPKGFIEITADNQETLISPHFKINQFLCKQAGGYPKYLVLKERLVLKLELILKKTNESGYPCGTFSIMSGYRTPYYNKLIGNVKYSRHVWGGAADIFIDENPEDGMMDDLDINGETDYRDAAVLYDIIDNMYEKHFYVPFIGGLGRYKKNYNHGPFVHVDTRGFRARWGI
ncbi:MAG: D-Ala-D-Ala carboxypeptidase family metallohydrolase [Pseudomonadota bacterium]